MSKYAFSSTGTRYNWSDKGLLSFEAAGVTHTTISRPVFSSEGTPHYRADVFPSSDTIGDLSGFIIFAAGATGPRKNDFVVEMFC